MPGIYFQKETNRHYRMLFIGAGFSAVYWCLESFRDAFVFHRGPFLQRLVAPDLTGFWMRILVVCVIMLFSARTQIMSRSTEEQPGRRRGPFGVILIGFCFSGLYWILEAFRDSFVFERTPFFKSLLQPDPMGLWMRMLAVCIIVLFSIYAQSLINARKRAEIRLLEEQAELEKVVRQRTLESARSLDQLVVEIEERKQAEVELRRSNRALKTLSEGNKALVRATSEADLLRNVCRICIEPGEYAFAWVGWCLEEQGLIEPAAWAGDVPDLVGSRPLSWLSGSAKEIENPNLSAETRVFHYGESEKDAPDFETAGAAGIQSMCLLPLSGEEGVFGVLAIYSRSDTAFNGEDIDLLEEMAHDLAFGIGVLRNREEQKRIKEELQNSEEKYRTLTENINAGIFRTTVDPDGTFLEANAYLADMLGYPDKNALMQMKVKELYQSSEDRQKLIDKLRANGFVKDEVIRLKKRDSTPIYASVTVVMVRDGKKETTYLDGFLEDITERRQAMEALRESEERYRTIAENTTDVIWMMNMDMSLVYVSPSIKQQLGYDVEEILTLPLHRFLAPRSLQTVQRMIAKIRHETCTGSQGESLSRTLELQMARKDGSSVLVEFMGTLVRDSEGNLTGIHGISRDITERKQMQTEIDQRKKYLEFVLNETPDAIITLNAQRHIVEWNRGAEKLFKYARHEVLGRDLDDLICRGEMRKEATRLTQMVLRGEKVPKLETVRYRKNGSPVHVMAAASPLRFSGVLHGIVAVYTDISERKRAEEELKRLNQSLKTLSEINISLVRDTDEKILLEDVCHILVNVGGYEAAWVGYRDPENEERIKSQALFAGNLGSFDPALVRWESVNVKDDPVGKALRTGGLSIIRGSIAEPVSLFDKGRMRSGICLPLKEKSRVFGVLQIISSDMEAFDSQEVSLLQEMANDLAFGIDVLRSRRIHEQAEKEKKRMHAQLLQAQKMEAVGILAGGIAHDFNNLLTAILGCADMAMMELTKDHTVYADLKEIVHASKRAAELTRQLLLFSRKQPMQYENVDLNGTIRNLIKMLQRLIGEDITIQTLLDDDLSLIRADAGTVEQVIMNLAVNARDAMPQGGRLEVSTNNVRLTAKKCRDHSEARPGKFVCLSVRDSGMGMSSDVIQHIFEPFFSTKGVGKGTGLGLSVVYGIIKQHNGWIDVQSRLNEGSQFEIYFPAVSEKKDKRMKKTPVQEKKTIAGKRILLIEDEERVREFAISGLGRSGFEVFAASNAREARQIFQNENGDFHLILSDVVLPDCNGLELVDDFLAQNPDLAVLLSSGYTDYQARWPSIEERGFRFLEKPYVLADLLHVIRDMAA